MRKYKSILFNKMPYGFKRMMQNHPWTGESHHFTNLFPHFLISCRRSSALRTCILKASCVHILQVLCNRCIGFCCLLSCGRTGVSSRILYISLSRLCSSDFCVYSVDGFLYPFDQRPEMVAFVVFERDILPG